MPQYKVTGPDGKAYRVNAPEGSSQQDAITFVAQTYYGDAGTPTPPPVEPQPVEEKGFFGALGSGLTTLGSAPEAAKFALGKSGAREELVKEAAEENKGRAEGFGMDKTLGENWQAFKEMAGESLGFMAAPAAAGLAASAVGTPVVGAGVAVGTLLSQYLTQNLTRQAQEDEARVARGEEALGASPGRALAAGVGQAGLDVAGFAMPVFRPLAAMFPFARGLVGAAGKEAAEEAAKKVVAAAAKNQLTIKGGIARGVAAGAAFELPQELAQTALERWQAGLDLGSDDAIDEYKQAAVGAVLLGGGLGGTVGGFQAARGKVTQDQEAKRQEAAALPDLASSEEKDEFARLLTPAVSEYINANPDSNAEVALKALRDDGTLATLGGQARANVEEAQAETGAGLDGGDRGPNVDVTGAAGPSVPDTGGTAPTEEVAEGTPPAEPIGVAGIGEPVGGVAGAEEGTDGTLTPSTPVEAAPVAPPVVAEAAPVAPPVVVEAAPVAPVEPVAPPAPVEAAPVSTAEQFNPDLAPAYTVEGSKAKMDAVRPVVADVFARVTGLDISKPKSLPANVQKALNSANTRVLDAVKQQSVVDPESVVREQLATFKVELPETAAPAAPEVSAAPVAPPAPAPTYSYADLIKEADSLVASNPDLVQPGDLSAQQFQRFSIQVDRLPALAEQGVEVPSPIELRQDLYKMAGREAPPMPSVDETAPLTAPEETRYAKAPVTPEAVEAETVAPEATQAEVAPVAQPADEVTSEVPEYDAEAWSAAQEEAPTLWARFSQQQKGKKPPAWEQLDEETQDNFVGAVAAAPVDVAPVERAKAIRPTFEAIRTGKPVPAPAVAPTAPEVAAPTEVVAEVEPAPVGFKTAMGSTYTVDAEGRTTRNKAERETPGHEGDFGPKETSAKTVYVDTTEQAAALSAAGLQGLGSKGARVAIKDGKATLLTWNPKAGKWGTTPSSRDIPVYSEPAVGRAPLELWRPAKDVPGYEAYSNMHAGNAITELLTPTPTPAPQVEVETEPASKAGGAGKPPKPPKPPKGATPSGSAPKKPRVVKVNKAKLQWAMREAGLLRRRDDAFRKKLLKSKTTQELNSSVGAMFFGTRAYQGPVNALKLIYGSLTPSAKRLLLPFMPTDDIARMAGDRLKNIPVVSKIIDDMMVYRNSRHDKTNAIQNRWAKFLENSPKGASLLNDVIKLADFHNVDPTQAATPEEYAKLDLMMRELRAAKASKQKLDNRMSQIREVYLEWRLLGQQQYGSGAGQQIFKQAKEMYRRNLIDSYNLTMERILSAGLNDDATKAAIARIKFMFRDALNRAVYFPVSRYGKYWFRVGTGKNSEYYMFESAVRRNVAFEEAQRNYVAEGGDPSFMDRGDNFLSDTDYLTKGGDASAALKDVFDLIGTDPTADPVQFKQNLREAVFEMYLLALPEGDMRKRFTTRRYVTGFETDSLRDFIATQNRAASQLARLAYSDKMRKALTDLRAEVVSKPDRPAMEPFVDEITARAKTEISPPVRSGFYALLDRFASLGNKVVFLWMLTAPKSALIQATQLHTVGLPVLADEFGFGKTMGIAGRYTTDILLGNKLATHRKDANGDIQTEFDINMRDSKFMRDLEQSDPARHKLLVEAYDYANSRDTFSSTYVSDLNNLASRPSQERSATAALKEGNVVSAVKQGGEAAMQFMASAFHQMESLNRQIMYMTSFELAYEQNKAKGMGDAKAKGAAMGRALKVTRETMFNYSNYNKPRAFKSPVGRVATQFMTYPVMMSSYLIRNSYGMLKGLDGEARISAAKRLFGTLGMTAMYAGLTGLPLYGVIFLAMEAARDMMRDDDEFAPYSDDEGNPLGKVNLKYWFENSWLPETFGPDSSVAKTFNLPPELAAILERSVKFGPLSAVSDVNIASSTSLSSLFFRGDVKADTLEGQFKEMVYNQLMGPLGGLIGNMARGVRLYEEGETTRAMELMLPAFVKGAVRASRLEEEGLETIDGKTIKGPEFYTMGKLFSQALGFGSTETYEMQKQNIEGQQLIEEIKAERQDLFQKIKSAELRATEKPTDANLRAIERANVELEKFNSRYPFSAIESGSLGEAITGAMEEQAGSIGGASLDAEYPVMEDVLARRVRREQ